MGEEDGGLILKGTSEGLTAVMRSRGCCSVAGEKEGGGTFVQSLAGKATCTHAETSLLWSVSAG